MKYRAGSKLSDTLTAVCAVGSLLLCGVLANPLGAQARDSAERPLPPLFRSGITGLDTIAPSAIRLRLGGDSLLLPMLPKTRLAGPQLRDTYRAATAEIESARSTAFQWNMRTIIESAWGQVSTTALATREAAPLFSGELTGAAKPRPAGARASEFITEHSDLDLNLNGRLELRGEKNQSARCGGQVFDPVANCRNNFEPLLDFQFSALSGGVVADRVHVNLDYDTQREFDASNNISVFYEGRGNELIQRIEAGNVTFQPPLSRFITAGIPSGNYGLQAIAKVGSMRLRTIAAQQKGNVVRDRVFTVGDRTLQAVERRIEDHQFEPRRFFLTVPPAALRGFPNIDILDRAKMASLSASLPDTLRPTKIFIYRLQIGAQPPNPAGPQFRIIGDPRSRRGQVYEYLREGVDYYADPSLLWIALVRPLSLNNERLVVAYRVRIGGRDTIHLSTGGTPDLEFSERREQFANLLWDPQVKPGDPAFSREIRSIYRLGGSDLRRQSLTLKVVTGSSADQERPISPVNSLTGNPASTYLELFALSQATNTSSFDVENRVWPRPEDPNFELSLGSAAGKIIRDQFLVFPSLQPFARSGLAGPANPRNDTIYSTPSEYLNSPQRPQSVYHLRIRYQAEGGGEGGTLMLGAVQLRQNSERLLVDGIPLVRGADYSVDYDLGRVSFSRPDTLFPRPRQVTVQYEENPLFAQTPTSIFGGSAEIPFENGQIAFTAISQTQKTTFNRPQLGFEPAASLVGGMTAAFSFDAAPLTRAVSLLPAGQTTAPSRISISGELAASRPRPNSAGQAYIEAFEGEGGFRVPLNDLNWYYSSQPAAGRRLLPLYGVNVLDLVRASTLAWQSNGLDAFGRPVRYSIEQIDPLTTLIGAGISGPEQLLWMTLYPLAVGGIRDTVANRFRWTVSAVPTGRRWRSIRTALGPSGSDLSRAENLEFWAQINISGKKDKNPVLVLDFGDISENSVNYGPDTLTVRSISPPPGAADARTGDSTYTGRKLQGFDRLDSERDPFSRAFNAGVNDKGLAGDLVGALNVVTVAGSERQVTQLGNFPTCRGGYRLVQILGDASANCTVNNNHLDDEDLDGDNVLNLTSADRDSEQWHRYIVNLADESRYTRIGKCSAAPATAFPTAPDSVCWVLFRIPFVAPDDSLGTVSLRRTRALRITMISGAALGDDEFNRVAIARLRLTGAPWLKRGENTLRGIAGEAAAQGKTHAGVIGTQDRNLTNDVRYESPPGVVDAPDRKSTFEPGRIQVNERSLRLTSTGMQPFERAEAYYRFPEGERNFMAYNELRLWARGIRNGWGEEGELHFYVKIGRDANNFYLYRTPLNGGEGKSSWLPEVRVDFRKLFALRAKIQNAYLKQSPSNTCTGLDSALIANTPIPAGARSTVPYAACSDGYVVYTLDPGTTPPNLAGVQEVAAGMIRVTRGTGSRPITQSDTLELWVDDIRLAGAVDETGIAGQLGFSVTASDFADIRMSMVRRDPHFRQLAEQPTFLTENSINISSSIHLEKFLPGSFGLAVPLTLNHTSDGSDPLFVSQSDLQGDIVEGLRKPRSSATSVALSVRRATPLTGSRWATVWNNLALLSAYTQGKSQTEYESGRARNLTVGLDYNLSRALLPNLARWSPAEIHLTSLYTLADDNRLAFLKPAESAGDSARRVKGLVRTWRNGGSFVVRPFRAGALRWDLSSVRDLRGYSDRVSFSAEPGLERERQMQTGFSFAPTFVPWLRPRVDFGSSYNMFRDPNAPGFQRVLSDSSQPSRLPRRLGNSQTFTAGVSIDPAKAMLTGRDSARFPGMLRALRAIQPIEVNLNRSLVSVYDGTPGTVPLAYQLAVGGPSRFREISGKQATSAGVITQLALNSSVSMPLGAVLVSRYQRINTRNWTGRLDTGPGVVDGTQVVFPDVGLRWSMRPRAIDALVSSVATNVRFLETRQFNTTQPLFPLDPLVAVRSEVDRGTSLVRSFPASTTIVWAGARPFTSTFGYVLSQRRENRPGLAGKGDARDYNVELAKSLKLPAAWKMPGDLRTRAGYQSTQGDNFVVNPLALGLQSRLTDNGRRALSFSADTDVAENLTSSFVVSRVISFDRNLNRHFTQTVLSAVMQLQFYAGTLK